MTDPIPPSECADGTKYANTSETPEPTTRSQGEKRIKLKDLTRNLGFIESLLLYHERKNLFQSIGIAVKLTRPERALTPETAYPAVRQLILSYPLLFLFPETNERGIWQWNPLALIAYKDVFQIDNNIAKCFAAETANAKILNSFSTKERLNQRKPLWKLVYYLQTHWLAFHCAHSFTDGGLVIAYLKEIVESINDSKSSSGMKPMARANTLWVFDLKEDLSLLQHKISPDIFEKLGFGPDLLTRMTIFISRLALKIWPGLMLLLVETYQHTQLFVDQFPVPISANGFFESDHVISDASPLNNVNPLFINIAQDKVQFLLGKCRSHGVRLQTYVVLIYIHTLHTLCPGLYIDKYLKIASAVSFRSLYPELKSHQSYLGKGDRFDDGFYSFVANFFISPLAEFSWENVRKYHHFLHTEIHSARWLRQYYIASQTLTPELYMDPRVESRKDNLFLGVTNLGEIEVADHSLKCGFEIENILFSPCSGATLGTHHLTMCSTKQSGLNIGFADGDHNVPNWKTFREEFRQNIVQLALREG